MHAFLARASLEYGRPVSEFSDWPLDDFVTLKAAQELHGWPSQPIHNKSGGKDGFKDEATAQLAAVFGGFKK